MPHNGRGFCGEVCGAAVAAVVRRTFRTMDSLALNSEEWAGMNHLRRLRRTVALLLACWMQQEAPEPHLWLISPPKVPAPLPDLEIENGIFSSSSGDIYRGHPARADPAQREAGRACVGIEYLDIDVELPGVGEDGMPGRNRASEPAPKPLAAADRKSDDRRGGVWRAVALERMIFDAKHRSLCRSNYERYCAVTLTPRSICALRLRRGALEQLADK